MVAAAILGVLLALAFLASGGSKLASVPTQEETRARLGVSPRPWRWVGVAEVAGAAGLVVGLAVPAIAVAAAVGFVVLMVGAAATHVRAHEAHMAAIPLVLAVAFVVYPVLRLAA
jgi:uncharacterized membrane protein YphA (DoxX/SURF4 family)